MTSKAAIAAIHACRKQVPGLAEEEDWRGFLEKNTGKRSLRAMTEPQLGRVLDALHAAGAPRIAGKRAGAAKRADGDRAPDAVRKIRALWLTLRDDGTLRDSSEAALNAFAKRQTGIDRLAWLDGEQAASVIEALKSWIEREDIKVLKPRLKEAWSRLESLEKQDQDLETTGYQITGLAGFRVYRTRDFKTVLAAIEARIDSCRARGLDG